VPVVGGAAWPLDQRPRLEFMFVERCGADVLIRARPDRKGRKWESR